jgi:2-methylcitrate dehydratase PrpD
MESTLARSLAEFSEAVTCSDLPPEVIEESKRVLLDSVGCALAAVNEPRGRMGIRFGVIAGGDGGPASIFGTTQRTSTVGAAFANAELICTLDFDAVLPPGHVSPFVLPSILAEAEARSISGGRVLEAIAISHEMSLRFGKAMDYTRDPQTGQLPPSGVFGYSPAIFGATAGVGHIMRQSRETLANGLGIAASISMVNSARAWMAHAPATTIKPTMAGPIAQLALTAAYMAELGHRGDVEILDDVQVGYPKFIGSSRWEPAVLLDGLGTKWRFPNESTYKPYPHCRINHGPVQLVSALVEEHGIRPDEISAIRAWGEAWVQQPVWMNEVIDDVVDAQFSLPHGIAMAAHLVPAGREWQDPTRVHSDSVMSLMRRTTFLPHPDYAEALRSNSAARPTRVEVDARGQTYSGERLFPRGTPSPDPSTFISTGELVEKFLSNAAGVIEDDSAERVVDLVMHLEGITDVAEVLAALRRQSNPA